MKLEPGAALYIAEFTKSGTWLVWPEDNERSDITNLIRLLTDCVDEAAVALTLFEDARIKDQALHASWDARWEARVAKERELQDQYDMEIPAGLSVREEMKLSDANRERATLETKHWQWQQGEWPNHYQRLLSSIHARTFIYAFDTLAGALQQLLKVSGIPAKVKEADQEFRKAFPDLRAVRNAAHHNEEFAQGKSFGKRIDLKAVKTPLIETQPGIMVSELLTDNLYSRTTADGGVGEVPVSSEALGFAKLIVQSVIDSLEWEGSPERLPR
ncbi:hypothetical protein ACIPY3_03090 [Paenarthrobacter sp. NPDC089714]|uniref:hypothetical protein n=1 Tax=Paenarthrobacter sp. NPDC089714 TaxID=3364377 RepID=UPI00382FDD06